MFNKNLIIYFHQIPNSKWFESLLLFLRKRYELISIDELENYFYNNKKLRNSLHLTFDDGHKSFYDIVFPIIKKYKIPVSLYVSPNITETGKNFWFQEIDDFNNIILKEVIKKRIEPFPAKLNNLPGKEIIKHFNIQEIESIIQEYRSLTNTPQLPSQNMNINQVLEVDQSGLVAVGAHTMSHPILKSEDHQNSRKEIEQSITELSRILGHEIKYFVYPNGFPDVDFSKREINYLKNINIKLAFSTKADYISPMNDPLNIPRFGISFGSNRYILNKLLFGKSWEVLKSLKGNSKIKNRKRIEKILKQNGTIRLQI